MGRAIHAIQGTWAKSGEGKMNIVFEQYKTRLVDQVGPTN